MNLEFTVTLATYSENEDCLVVIVDRIVPDECHECFEIRANFAFNRFEILDRGSQEGDVAPDYAAQILLAFMRAWKKAYYALPAEDAPDATFRDTFFKFTVEIEA